MAQQHLADDGVLVAGGDVGGQEQLQQALVAQLVGERVLGGDPLAQARGAGVGQRVDRALAAAGRVVGCVDQAHRLQALELGVDRAVARGPEEADRAVDERLDVVARLGAERQDSEHGAGGGVEVVHVSARYIRPIYLSRPTRVASVTAVTARATAGLRGVDRVPPQALLVVSITSVQFGGAIAVHLFGDVGPAGSVLLRLGVRRDRAHGVVSPACARAHARRAQPGGAVRRA